MYCLARYQASDLPKGTRDVWGITGQWVEQYWLDSGTTEPMPYESIAVAAREGKILARRVGCTIRVEKI